MVRSPRPRRGSPRMEVPTARERLRGARRVHVRSILDSSLHASSVASYVTFGPRFEAHKKQTLAIGCVPLGQQGI